MPRAPSGLSLLLMAGLAFATSTSSTTSTTIKTTTTTTSPLEIINPWLSASDLQSVFAAADLRPACSPHKPSCPPPCPAANSTNSTQCLYYLKESHKEEVCGRDWGPERRRNVLHGLRMRHCCEHAVDSALPQAAFSGGNTCRQYLDALLELDHLADRVSCGHADLLTRYDCGQNYSIAHHCNNCKEAYRRWVCSSLVPHYTRAGERIKPCLSVCQQVEQQCPYLLPESWTNTSVPPGETAYPTPQYAGEPTFLCIDPNIPETGEQRAKSLRGSEDCCYSHCSSPGRGGTSLGSNLQATTSINSGGGGTTSQILGVCEHCPGRPPNISQHNNNLNNNITNNNNNNSKKKNNNNNINNGSSSSAAAESPVYRAAGAHQATSSSSSASSSIATTTTTSSLSSTSTSSSSDGVVTRTFNKVFLLWTAWITILEHTQTIYNTLKYLLVLCVTSVWTTWLTLLKPKQQQQQRLKQLEQLEQQQHQQLQQQQQQQHLVDQQQKLLRWLQLQKKTIFSRPTCS